MHILKTGVIAGLFAAENGFHLVGQAVEHGFRGSSNSSSARVATEKVSGWL
jgi:hypothetical protein